jgi:hypothetical protein
MAGQSALPSEGTTRVPKFGRVDVGATATPRRQCKTIVKEDNQPNI